MDVPASPPSCTTPGEGDRVGRFVRSAHWKVKLAVSFGSVVARVSAWIVTVEKSMKVPLDPTIHSGDVGAAISNIRS